MRQQENTGTTVSDTSHGGLAVWLLEKLRGAARRPSPRMALLERITIAPRQSLALIEAEGRRFLVATSPEGAPAFYELDNPLRGAASTHSNGSGRQSARVSW
jgi:flagellar biogenesis protein FliO